MAQQVVITNADIESTLPTARLYLNTSRIRATTALRRHQQTVAAARDALASALLVRFNLKGFQQLTKAIRAGHQGADTDFDAINLRAVQYFNLEGK